MLRGFFLLILLGFSFTLYSQAPSNDNPCNATNLGTLPTPGACTSGLQNGAPITLSNQSTVGATGASPYIYQTQCSGGGNQQAPALDTWYSFVASGYIVNVTVSGFPNASIALWTGTCNNLSTALGCSNLPSGGTGTLTFNQMVVGQTYWIEVSGGTSTATDASFSISVDNDIDCNDCLTQGNLTVNPLPVNGGYTAGQVVNFCYTVTGWTQINTNWFHGVQISMAPGWTGTITNTVPATTLQNIPGPGSDGDWLFYPAGIGTVNGTNWGPGFYFDTPDAGTNANDNFGDNCNGSVCTWTFCWSLTVGPCTPGMSLNVTVNTSGDGESGSWSNAGCSDDNATTFAAIGVCCTPPTVSIPSQTICSGSSTTLTSTVSPTGGTYSWQPGGQTTANISVSPVTTTTYTLTYVTGSCSNTATSTVTVNAQTVPTFTQVAPICSGGSFTLPTTSNNGITGTWSPAVNNTATTTYTFTPTAGQCATTTTMTVTVNAQTVPTFTQVAPICSGGSFTLPTTSNNGITGTWSPAVNNTATTTYTFTPAAGECATTTTMTVTVNAQTVPTFTQVAPICSGGSFTLPTTSNNGITGTWSPAVNNTATTTYTFTPTAGQCATTTTMTVTVNAQTVPTFTQVAPICSGGSFTLPTTSNNGITGTWSPAVNNTTTTTYTFTPAAGQCATTTTMTVIVNAVPNLSFVADTLNGCAPLQVNFSNLSTAGNCQWQIGNGINLSGCNPNYLFTSAGCFDVTLTAELNGCSSTITYQDYICVEEPPVANFSVNPTIFSAPYQMITFINSSVGASSYSWDFGDNTSSIVDNPTHFYTNTENGYMITLTAYSQFGCSDQVQVPIDYAEVEIFYVPNTFTPDGDNYNQSFHAIFTSGYDPYNFEMLIFNRWGELIWESHDVKVGWDGTYGHSGIKVQDGVYTWKINFKHQKNDKKRVVVGHVNVIR